MKAIRFSEYGDASVLHYEDAEQPQPAGDQILVQVAATSFNPIDAALRAGYLQQLFPVQFPHTPGIDVAGTVAEVGAADEGFATGDQVVGFLTMTENGSAADYVLAPADVLTAAPSSIPFADAAPCPKRRARGRLASSSQICGRAADTGQRRRRGRRRLRGPVGQAGGAYVIATASARSTDAVRAHGADDIIDYTATKVTDPISEPLDVVLSLVMASAEGMAALVGLIRPGGVSVTSASVAQEGTERSVRMLSLFVRGDAAGLAVLGAKVDAGDLLVDVTASYPLSELAEVHEQGAAGRFRGKVIVTPTD